MEYDEEIEYELEDPKTVNPSDTNLWRTATCPDEIEFVLRLRNQRHFGQAETDGTLFTTKSMKEKFDWAGSTDEADMTLNGTYVDADMSSAQQLFTKNLVRVTDPDASTQTLTYKEFRSKMKIWRESTSTSPSGRHLGHYKVLVSPID